MEVNVELLKQQVQEQMPEQRWMHTLGVLNTAIDLAERYGADVFKAKVAAIIHDVAKYWDADRQRQMIIDGGGDQDLLNYPMTLWHAEVAGIVATQQFGITDEDTLNAIKYHTTGRANMSLLEKVICLADIIEPGRNFEGVDTIRQKAKENLDSALLLAFDHTLHFLIARRQKLHPLTIMARNDLLDQVK